MTGVPRIDTGALLDMVRTDRQTSGIADFLLRHMIKVPALEQEELVRSSDDDRDGPLFISRKIVDNLDSDPEAAYKKGITVGILNAIRILDLLDNGRDDDILREYIKSAIAQNPNILSIIKVDESSNA